MSLTVNRTEEKEANWADLIDGLRYAGFRRSMSNRSPNDETLDAEKVPPGSATKRNTSESEPS